MFGDDVRVEFVVVDQHDDEVSSPENRWLERHERKLQVFGVDLGDERIAHGHLGAAGSESFGDFDAWAFAPIAGASFVGQAQQQYLAAVHALLLVVEHGCDPAEHIVGHVFVHVVGQFDKPKCLAEVLFDSPCQVARVDGQAVAADAWARREPHIAKWFGRCGVDRAPDVHIEFAGEHRELVYQSNVDMAEGVLKQFHQFGFRW